MVMFFRYSYLYPSNYDHLTYGKGFSSYPFRIATVSDFSILSIFKLFDKIQRKSTMNFVFSVKNGKPWPFLWF